MDLDDFLVSYGKSISECGGFLEGATYTSFRDFDMARICLRVVATESKFSPLRLARPNLPSAWLYRMKLGTMYPFRRWGYSLMKSNCCRAGRVGTAG